MLEMRKLRNEWVHMAYTENGALTYRTTGSACLNLFGTIGAMRNAKEEEICVRFLEEHWEDLPDIFRDSVRTDICYHNITVRRDLEKARDQFTRLKPFLDEDNQ